jgi:RNA polymerase sigma factor (sigma-70 family)
MKNTGDENWGQLLDGLKVGDPDSCRVFWEQYGTMLEAVAQRQISQRLQRRVGADDVVQSACRTFFRRIATGQFELPDSESLWRLMCTITVTKARRAVRDQSRQKRGMQQEQYLDAVDEGSRGPQIESPSETPFEAVAVADQLETLLQRLTEEECSVLDFKLQQMTNDEIASEMDCSERTVRRLVKKIQSQWLQMIDDEQTAT